MPEFTQTRREFLKSTFAAVMASATAGMTASSYARVIGSNDRIRVGAVGFAERSLQSLLPACQRLSTELNWEIAALSDIWNRRRDEGRAFLKQLTGHDVAVARNNEELYEMKDVDAVIIATADFQHAVHGVEAVKAGRHAYVEKPLAQTMDDARAIFDAVKQSDRIVQIGTQRRSGDHYIRANDYIRSGQFGEINMVEMCWNVNQPGRWRRPELVESIRQEDTDWKRYLINRPHVPWDPRKYIEYRLFMPYSTGIPGQWMVHQIDTIAWFTGYDYPRSVVASGGIYQWPDGRTNPDTLTAIFEYGPPENSPDSAKGFQVVYTSRMGNSAGGTKELYYSNGGMINLDTAEVTPTGGLGEREAAAMGMPANLLANYSLRDTTTGTATRNPRATRRNRQTTSTASAEGQTTSSASAVTSANTGVDSMTLAHMRNWMECVRSGKQPNADVQAGYNHSVAVCMVMASLESGKRARYNAEKREIYTES